MTAVPALELDDFAKFFRVVHGTAPFPWQERLVRTVVREGWPALLDLPTGTGKTAAIDAAVFALAYWAASGEGPRQARRIVYAVDRRTIVSQAYDRARRIEEALLHGADDVLRRMREQLASLSEAHVPMRTAQLRGGIARDNGWCQAPDQPLVVVSTVDQTGSRLLFRGYGVTDEMRSVHAALLGSDVLYLLDEVHLSQPFTETLSAIASRYRTWAAVTPSSPFVAVEMSATPGRLVDGAFSLNHDDRADPVLSRRLTSAKPVALVGAKPNRFLDEMVKQIALASATPGATVAAIVNRVHTARSLYQRLAGDESLSAHLLTGRMRPFDRQKIDERLLQRIRAGRSRSAATAPLVVVATQTIEAGADFDFDALISECASIDALRQRFGRLDRLGELAGAAKGVIVAASDVMKTDPVYGDAAGATWEWLNGMATEGTVDFGLSSFALPPEPGAVQPLLAPKAHAPILLPAHLDAWVQTSPAPTPDPDISLWLHGPERGAPDVQIVWRADLTEGVLRAALDSDDISDAVIAMVDALPPVTSESLTVPFVAAKRWLEGLPEPGFADVEGEAIPDDQPRGPLPGHERPAVLWKGDKSTVILAADLRPGHTIVVPQAYGGLTAYNWDPNGIDVHDVAELAAFQQGRRPVLRLHPAIVGPLLGVAPPVPGAPDDADTDVRQTVRDWLMAIDLTGRDRRVQDLVAALLVDSKPAIVTVEGVTHGAGDYFVIQARRSRLKGDAPQGDGTTSDSERSSFTGEAISLRSHQEAVSALAASYSAHLDLGPELQSDLTLSGLWHDAGKADFRFQRWLHGGSEFKARVQSEPLAKSLVSVVGPKAMRDARARAGYPPGGRHELMSLALLDDARNRAGLVATDWDLVLHLVASHHGRCRPFAPWIADEQPVDVTFTTGDITTTVASSHTLARLDSGVAQRFWNVVRRYGWWESALLEAVLRLADQRQSAREDQRA